MYYISDNKSDLEAYNNIVSIGEKYDGETTLRWAKVIEHPNGLQFAILKHDKYHDDNLQSLKDLDESWFDLPF